MLLPLKKSINQKVIRTPLRDGEPIQLWIKREDLLHPDISGNKYRKLRLQCRTSCNARLRYFANFWWRLF
jgi:1-aminocyclopropane-1-carboxylate deaminase/D-cysteine desulfhydrase-like pyridoxal-dependent ACC family enzyme